MRDNNCSTFALFKQYPAFWGTGTKTKVLSFCGVLPLITIDKLNFFSSCNLVTSSSLLYSTQSNFYWAAVTCGLTAKVVGLRVFFVF